MSFDHAPDPIIMYTRSVETILDAHEIELYWGSIAGLVERDSIVLLSTNIFHPTLRGKAWSALQHKFPALIGKEQDMKICLRADPASALWKLSDTLRDNWEANFAASPQRIPCVFVVNSSPSEELPRKVFCVKTPPFRKDKWAQEEDYIHILRACFAAIRAQESHDLTIDAKTEPYDELILSAIAGQQGRKPEKLLKDLIEETSNWLRIAPRIKRIRIAYWDPDIARQLQKEQEGEEQDHEQMVRKLRSLLLSELGEVRNSINIPASLPFLVQETIELIDSILESGALPSELHGSLQALRLTLTREDHTVLEVGAATGKLTEGLVTHLHTEFFGKPPGTFFNGIEAISQKPPTQEKYKSRSISKWFYSYLHTLRVLRNESAHSQTESIRFPLHLEHDDLSVLLSNLGRVLRLHISIIQ